MQSICPVILLNGQSLEAMAAADAVLLACGTAALECMLLKRPMVVAYRLSALTYRVARLMVRTEHYSLPNLLAGRTVVSEIIQQAVTPETLGREIMRLIDSPQHVAEIRSVFSGIHGDLRHDANRSAAEAVLELVGRNGYQHG